METKKCSKCGEIKSVSEFYFNKLYKDKYSCRCKNCIKFYVKEYAKTENYKEKKKIQDKKYREKNKNKINLKNKQYRENNVKKYRESKLKYHSLKLKTDPEYKLKHNISVCFRGSLKRINSVKNKLFFQYTEIQYSDYIKYFKTKFPIEFAEIKEKNKYHIDHIIPCDIYDFNNPEEIKKCWQPENLRLVLAKENIEKYNKLDFDLIEKHNIWHLLPERYK